MAAVDPDNYWSIYLTKEQMIESVKNWDHSLNSKYGTPIWHFMGKTDEEFIEWIRNCKDV